MYLLLDRKPKQRHHKYKLRNKLKKKIKRSFEIVAIHSFKDDSKQHLAHTNYNTQLHFKRIQKFQFVDRKIPNRINTYALGRK
jgi:hypothetical protein